MPTREELFKPIRIGKIEIKNRVAFLPISTHFGTAEGDIDEQTIAYMNARARGGAGLLITFPISTRETFGFGPMHNKLFRQSHYIGVSNMVEQVHIFGAKIFMQVSSYWGKQGAKTRRIKSVMDIAPAAPRGVGPSPIPIIAQTRKSLPPKMVAEYKKRGIPLPLRYPPDEPPRELTIKEIQEAESSFVNAAERAQVCGFDGLEIHACHGGGIWAFLSPRTNIRTDIYGGSLQNRMRYLKNCFLKAKGAARENFVVGIRLSFEDALPGGYDVEATKIIAKEMERVGVDYISFDNGSYEDFKNMLPDEDGTLLSLAAELKDVVKIPIITASIHDPDMAEEAIKEGKTDMIGLGRQLLCDPEWPNRVAQGKRFVKCDRCNLGCWQRLKEGLPIRCRLNPGLGFERYMPEYWPKPPFREGWKAYGIYDIHVSNKRS